MTHSTFTNAPASLPGVPVSVIGEKYKVSRLLGEGGMGSVYEAENTWTRRRVAIKLMRPEYASDPEAAQRFLREAQSAAQIDHPNVVSVLDMGRDNATGSLYIVQEFLTGMELRALMDERKALAAENALEIILPVLDGLIAAHALGVVHRDLKPENIFLVRSRSGRTVPKLIDFGIAKALRPRENEFRTIIGQTMGTPGYMSPEQARGDLDIDARTDVWAMGIVLYEMLSGRIPYDDDGNVQVMLAQVLTREPMPLEQAAPFVARELCAVIGRALQRDRAHRYPDMQSFYNALSGTSLGGRVRDTLRRVAPAEGQDASLPPSFSQAPPLAGVQSAAPSLAPAVVAAVAPPAPPVAHGGPSLAPQAVVPVSATQVVPPRRSRALQVLLGVLAVLLLLAGGAELALRVSSGDPAPQPTVSPAPVTPAPATTVAQPTTRPAAHAAPTVAPAPQAPAPAQAPPGGELSASSEPAEPPRAGDRSPPPGVRVLPHLRGHPRGGGPGRRRHGGERGANGAVIVD